MLGGHLVQGVRVQPSKCVLQRADGLYPLPEAGSTCAECFSILFIEEFFLRVQAS